MQKALLYGYLKGIKQAALVWQALQLYSTNAMQKLGSRDPPKTACMRLAAETSGREMDWNRALVELGRDGMVFVVRSESVGATKPVIQLPIYRQ
ncbi:hypothetical protein [Tolypothrix bouteillei]|uniref:Uncharacterized protein n=1 Tax=Tolypothrix bouteillei VB521301 TaxID=1479485 RepID=A0A0C1NG24_9CYAN|nr:hypothetical protein [Tolypothrix bouteillei]KAF3884069.1 hypothetical protein DA73_0400000050 [Tolypothrix bouteillei VB521301]